MFVFVALQNKLTVDEFPDALDGESHLEDREKGFTSLVQFYYRRPLYSALLIHYDNSLFSLKLKSISVSFHLYISTVYRLDLLPKET